MSIDGCILPLVFSRFHYYFCVFSHLISFSEINSKCKSWRSDIRVDVCS